MIYFTQLIYIHPGQEKIFDDFENVAIPLIPKYNGKLLLRVRPGADSFLGDSTEKPYEIHVVQFPAQSDFESFMRDETRKQFVHLKEKAIQKVVLIQGAVV